MKTPLRAALDLRLIWVLAGMLTAPAAGTCEDLPEAPKPPPGDRTAVFISDLHMGVGIEQMSADSENPATWENTKDFTWHPTEDFRWHREFRAFLEQINRTGKNDDGKSSTDLVILGDFLELWQSLWKDCDHSKISKDLGCTETEAIRRVTRVVEQHRREFEDLGWFADQDENRVVVVPGNHDIALAYPRVRDIVIDGFDSKTGQVRIATEGYWMSADGRIFSEHGQQIGKDPNAYPGYPAHEPFIDKGDTRYLLQPWGEQLVQEFYNRYEGGDAYRWSVIDNLAEKIKGVRYGLKAGGVLKEGSKAVGRAARFVLTQTSWRQTRQILDENKKPIWDLDKIEKDPALFLAQSLPAGDPLRIAFEAELDRHDAEELAAFDESEIQAICDLRWATSEADKIRAEADRSGVKPCPDTGQLGTIAQAVREKLFRNAKDKRFRRHLKKMRDSVPEGTRPTSDFSLFVFGHTHKERSGYRPFDSDAEWQPVVFNDGAWQRRATPDVFCTIAKQKKVAEKDAIKVLQPEDLPACYPYVTVKNRANESLSPQLRYWVEGEDGKMKVRSGCTAAPDIHPDC